MKEYLVRDFPRVQIIADTYYETANKVIKEVYCKTKREKAKKSRKC
jgi:hypothetical protein